MAIVRFPCPSGEYPVTIGAVTPGNLRAQANERDRLFFLADRTAWELHGADFASLGAVRIVEPGERSKTAEMWVDALRWLAGSGADRRSLLVGFGGGMVCDLAGFVAATYMRGIRHAFVATTLLAQVDAALGGKTAIDLPEGKNLVGAFHHPIAVFCDPLQLSTLDRRHLLNGMAEVIKYGFALDPALLERLSQGLCSLDAAPQEFFAEVVERCCLLKARVVADDPNDTLGIRAKLNFGHTVGHALEAAGGYQRLLHGEAVAIGMCVECNVGERLGVCAPGLAGRVRAFLKAWGLPHALPDFIPPKEAMTFLHLDKKATQEKGITLVVPERLGECRVVEGVSITLIEEALGL
ncbi:MAG: 3-dehydroquinate synthase [Armatimonadota bacterium]